VAFKTDNDIGKVLSMNKVDLQRTKYENSGVYQDHVLSVILIIPDTDTGTI